MEIRTPEGFNDKSEGVVRLRVYYLKPINKKCCIPKKAFYTGMRIFIQECVFLYIF